MTYCLMAGDEAIDDDDVGDDESMLLSDALEVESPLVNRVAERIFLLVLEKVENRFDSSTGGGGSGAGGGLTL